MNRMLEEKLDWLFRDYRAACPTPEPSANFMPDLWAKIDSRRSVSWIVPLRAWATRVAAVAGLAAALLAGSVGLWQKPYSSQVLEVGYVDVLAEDAADESDGDLWLLVGNSR
jgi:hypothetical protein